MTTQTKGVTPAFKHAIGAGFDRTDYSVVVKNRARLPKPWRWEIYRAGRQSPVEHSRNFSTCAARQMSKAKRRSAG